MVISIVIPAYNEAGNIEEIVVKLKACLEGKADFELIFVDDGSTDQTLAEIQGIMKTEKFVKYISLSRNFGHQKALKAGLDHAMGECVISMDADMQHPPELVGKLIEKWKEGYDVVYTIRRDSPGTGFFKRATSKAFYLLINWLSEIEIPLGAADFRLLDRKVVDELKKFQENWLFIRGLVSWLGFRQTGIEYTAQPRFSGRSKYSLVKMVSFAIEGVTSFSIFPLRVATFTGLFCSIISFSYLLYAAYVKLFTKLATPGWASLLMTILLLGGIQLISLGLIGEYLGKMFIESKRRPTYVIKQMSV
ncbi:glycosyltransferase family 2 protein [Desulfococcus sp.]|uniref:glycosyltransferase family 2 protein n=1 Tax=Desulfococcus sp. TaxID=2025834 RepID=UPI0035932114